jgi:DNA-binding CsgD family transcriptional regulator
MITGGVQPRIGLPPLTFDFWGFAAAPLAWEDPPVAWNAPTPGLLDREEEIATLAEAVRNAASGLGSLLLIEASAGLGKTRLAGIAAELARDLGAGILGARGGELERTFRFGIVRQLFESTIASLSRADRGAVLAGAAGLSSVAIKPVSGTGRAVADQGIAVLHGLYWLTANLAAERPLVLIVDDAHWSDRASLEWLVYLARRIDDLPVVLVVCSRPDEPGAEVDLLAQLAAEPAARTVQPKPLSTAAVRELVRQFLDSDPDTEFVSACREATGGNPFLVIELLVEARERGMHPDSSWAGEVRVLGPTTVSRAVLVRLRRISETAVEVAKTVALLGAAAELGYVAAVVGVPEQGAAEVIDLLVRSGILEYGPTIDFTHPVLREAVYSDLPRAARSVGHKRAASLLRDRGAAPELVAAQLMASDPDRDENVVAWLVEIADEMLARGSPSAAADYLERALAEPPPEAARGEVLSSLAFALGLVGPSTERNIELLTEALRYTAEPRRRAEIKLVLARALGTAGRLEEAMRAYDDATAEASGVDADLAFALEVERIAAGIVVPGYGEDAGARLRLLERPLDGRTLAQCTILAVLAFLAIAQNESPTEVADLAERALASGAVIESLGSVMGGDRHGFVAYMQAVFALIYAEHHDAAARYAGRGADLARQQGSLVEFVASTSMLATVALRRGDVLEAEARAREAVGAARDSDLQLIKPLYLSTLVDVLVERDELDEANSLLVANGLEGEAIGYSPFTFAFLARARVRLAQGRAAEGLADVNSARDRELTSAVAGPRTARLPWRSLAATAHLALGEREEALPVAREEVALAREFGAPRQLGIALRAAGVVEGGAKGLGLLQESIAVLGRSTARLELARSLTEYGAALRRTRQRTASREPLRRALDLAHRCGGTAVANRAQAELLAAGGRPRRVELSGPDSLTASERRIAELAARGMTNREIAQAQFISMKTVGTHLAHVYQKLNLTSRKELADALAA